MTAEIRTAETEAEIALNESIAGPRVEFVRSIGKVLRDVRTPELLASRAKVRDILRASLVRLPEELKTLTQAQVDAEGGTTEALKASRARLNSALGASQ